MSDARNIALTSEATAAADTVEETLRLSSGVEAVRIGLAYAIRHEVTLDREAWGATDRNYNVATVDTQDGELRRLVTIFYDTPEAIRAPYHVIETLMNKGLLLLRDHIREGTVQTLADLCTPPRDSAA